MKKIIAGLLIWTQIAFAGKLQDADFKTEAQLISAGATASSLLNDTKIYVTANGINKKLSTAITAGDIGGGGSGKSYLTNSNFENSTVATGWTVTNSTATAEATEIVEGSQSIKLALSAQTGDLLVQSVTPSIKTSGQNFEASCRIKTTLTTVQVCGLVGGSEMQCVSVPSGSTFVQVPINITPSDGVSFGVKVKATSSSTGNIYVDDCYAGQARNIGSVNLGVRNLVSYWLSANFSASTSTPINFDSKEFDADNMVTTSPTAWKYIAKTAGVYLVTLNAYSTSNTNFDVYKNGSLYKGLIYSISSSNSNSNSTKVLLAANDYIDFRPSGSVTVVGGSLNVHNTSNVSISLISASSEQAVKANAISQPTVQRFLSGSGTYTRPNGVTSIKVKMVGGGGGGGGASSNTAGSGGGGGGYIESLITNPASTYSYAVGSGGSTGSAGSSTTFGSNTANGGGAGGTGAIGGAGGSGTLSLGTGFVATGGGGGASGLTNVSVAFAGGAGGSSSVGGGAPAPAVNGVGISAAANSGGGGSGTGNSGGGTAGSGGSGVIIVEETYGFNAPIAIGSVTSDSTSSNRDEWATVTNNGSTCAVSNLSTSGWVTCSRNGTGRCDCTIAKPFTSSVKCDCTSYGTSSRGCSMNSPSTTAFSVWHTLNGNSVSDDVVGIECKGAR